MHDSEPRLGRQSCTDRKRITRVGADRLWRDSIGPRSMPWVAFPRSGLIFEVDHLSLPQARSNGLSLVLTIAHSSLLWRIRCLSGRTIGHSSRWPGPRRPGDNPNRSGRSFFTIGVELVHHFERSKPCLHLRGNATDCSPVRHRCFGELRARPRGTWPPFSRSKAEPL